MAIEDALRVIDESWTDIEPRLTARELTALANIDHVAIGGVDREEKVFQLIAPALPPDSGAWPALRSSSTRFSPGAIGPSVERIVQRCIERAQAAVTSPSFPLDAAADFLSEAAEQQVLGRSLRVRGARALPETLSRTAIFTEIDGEMVYPAFQFQYVDGAPVAIHEIVVRLFDRLGGAE